MVIFASIYKRALKKKRLQLRIKKRVSRGQRNIGARHEPGKGDPRAINRRLFS
jgi:hypothetical protein